MERTTWKENLEERALNDEWMKWRQDKVEIEWNGSKIKFKERNERREEEVGLVESGIRERMKCKKG